MSRFWTADHGDEESNILYDGWDTGQEHNLWLPWSELLETEALVKYEGENSENVFVWMHSKCKRSLSYHTSSDTTYYTLAIPLLITYTLQSITYIMDTVT